MSNVYTSKVLAHGLKCCSVECLAIRKGTKVTIFIALIKDLTPINSIHTYMTHSVNIRTKIFETELAETQRHMDWYCMVRKRMSVHRYRHTRRDGKTPEALLRAHAGEDRSPTQVRQIPTQTNCSIETTSDRQQPSPSTTQAIEEEVLSIANKRS